MGEKVEDLTEEAAEELKGQVTKITNEYMKDVLDSGADAVGSGFSGAEGQSSSSVASMLRFGYKDYLMLFTFLGLCVNEDALLLRVTASIPQQRRFVRLHSEEMRFAGGKSNLALWCAGVRHCRTTPQVRSLVSGEPER